MVSVKDKATVTINTNIAVNTTAAGLRRHIFSKAI